MRLGSWEPKDSTKILYILLQTIAQHCNLLPCTQYKTKVCNLDSLKLFPQSETDSKSINKIPLMLGKCVI